MESPKQEETTLQKQSPIQVQLPEPSRSSDLFRQLHIYRATIVAIVIAVAGAFFLVVPELFKTSENVSRFFRLLGTVFLPTGFISFVYESMLRTSLLQLMKRQLEEALQVLPTLLNQLLEPRFNSLNKELYTTSRFRDAGLTDVHQFLSTDLESRFARATHSIRILQTWIPDAAGVENQFHRAISNGANLRILLLDPDSPHAAIRNKEVGLTDGVVSNQINANLADLTKFCQDHPDCAQSIQVRLYDGSSVFSLYASDDTYVLGLFWRGKKAIQGPQFVIEGKDSYIAKAIDEHFEIIWNSAREFPIVPCKNVIEDPSSRNFTNSQQPIRD
jgi:hypothetical protein